MDKFFVSTPVRRLPQALEVLPALGAGPEIYLSARDLDEGLDDLPLENLAARLRAAGLSCTMHAPFIDLSPGGVDSRVVAATRERFQQAFAVAEIFRPRVMVFHSGYDRWRFAFNLSIWLENSISFWEPFVARARDLGTGIAVENIFETSPVGLKMLFAALDSPHFGACFDIGHWFLFGKVDLEEWLLLLREHLLSFHLHDNRGGSDDHLVPGEGLIDFKTLRRLVTALPLNPRAYTFEPHDINDVARGVAWLQEQYG